MYIVRQTALLLALLFWVPVQGALPRYAPELLSCAAFKETVASRIRNQSGTVIRDEQAGREGILIVQAVRSDSGLWLTAWYDSLTVWREGPEGRVAPDGEGMLGGRWRGVLSSTGRYTPDLVPFVPDQVAEIADLRGVPNDFLPLLEAGTIRRVGTRAGDGGRTRYAWTIKSRSDTTGIVSDTLPIPMRRESNEEGSLLWDPGRGPVRWERAIKIDGRIDAGGAIKRGMHSLVIQQITVERLADRPGCT